MDPKRTASQVRQIVAAWRRAGETIALVPTMGNLHAGHLSLVELASARADRVIVTIFVNPTQFGVGEDFAAYPRTLEEDRRLIEQSGKADALFVPDVAEIYPFGTEAAFQLDVPPLGQELCGAARPGHFNGVAGVVLRLLNIVGPDLLVLGQKDYQQLLIIERMIADLRLPVAVLAGDTQRDRDGLAISSRNHYLTADERRQAPILHSTLEQVGARLADGDRDYQALQNSAIAHLESSGFKPEYVEVRRASDLGKPNGSQAPEELIVLAAAWLGRARLIDNLIVHI
ncbi:MAG: pantoate--beta-alanine ligase [Gammaproteobacteria bacterium]